MTKRGGRVDSPNSKVYYTTNAPRRLSMRLAFLIPPMMLLAACGSEEKKAGEGTEISINAEGDGGGIKIQTGKDGGKIRIGGDGAAINIDGPDFIDLDVASDFAIDGVKLYPGSQVTRVDVDAEDENRGEKATVKRGFPSPAAPKPAAACMAAAMATQGLKAKI